MCNNYRTVLAGLPKKKLDHPILKGASKRTIDVRRFSWGLSYAKQKELVVAEVSKEKVR